MPAETDDKQCDGGGNPTDTVSVGDGKHRKRQRDRGLASLTAYMQCISGISSAV